MNDFQIIRLNELKTNPIKLINEQMNFSKDFEKKHSFLINERFFRTNSFFRKRSFIWLIELTILLNDRSVRKRTK